MNEGDVILYKNNIIKSSLIEVPNPFNKKLYQLRWPFLFAVTKKNKVMLKTILVQHFFYCGQVTSIKVVVLSSSMLLFSLLGLIADIVIFN